ncbi:MAG TPA: hypothetical protein GXZ95_00125 [Mollicutes bacterium]|nr:hypothetical protein [Mollicutes bacterium]
MKITNMKKMALGKYKLTLDDKKEVILHEDVVIKNVLLLGKNIDDKLMDEINEENIKATVYNQALNYISRRIRSREEVEKFLLRKNYDKKQIDYAIQRLESENYINDYLFATAYVNDKLHMSNDGPNKMRKHLTNLKVDESIISEVISKIDDSIINDKIDKLIDKQIRLKNKYRGNILKNKILNYLINLGYERDIIVKKLEGINLDNKKDIQKEYQKLYKKYGTKYSGSKLEMVIKQKLYQKGYDISDLGNTE